MHTSVHSMKWLGCAFASACVLWLVACGKTEVPPTPQATPAMVPPAQPPTSATEAPTLPPNAAQGDPIPKPTDGVRRPAQQSDDKPMPGQNNDHSAPLTPSR